MDMSTQEVYADSLERVMSQEWIVATVIIIAIVVVAAATIMVLLCYYDRQNIGQSQYGQWNVELWNIQHGFRVNLEFNNSAVLGRYTLFNMVMQEHPQIEIDNAISREHVLLYEQDRALWGWNLSAVNPAMINGHRMNTAQRIVPGIRIELGNSVFLVTRVDYIAVKCL